MLAQSANSSSPELLTNNLVAILNDMPVSSKDALLIKELRSVNKEQYSALTQVHKDVMMYLNQIRDKYGEDSAEMENEIDYQKDYYLKQLKKVLNTHQFAYINTIQKSKSQSLEDIVDVNKATKEEIQKAKSKLRSLQQISVIEFEQL